MAQEKIEAPAKDGKSAQSGTSGTEAKTGNPILRERFMVDLSKPLPDLDMPQAHAFQVADKRNPDRNLYALVCDTLLPPRINVMRTMKGVSSVGLMTLVEWGVIDWPPIDGRAIAVIYERPLGGRVMTNIDSVMEPIPDQQVLKLVVKPLITALTELQSHSTVHRAIRPTNLYWMDRKQTKLVLGDCTTVPPAFDQPVVCETIESGMALPEGRGPGYYPDDMYALGVTLGIVALGRSPRRGVDPNTLVRDKVMSGSYPSLFAEERVPLQLIELVRGLTIDEEDDRWSLESIELWQNGRRMPTAHTKQDRRSMRPFIFKDVEYAQTRQLAYAMSQDWEAAAVPIMEEKVETWLRRGLELPELADAVASQVKTAKAAMGGAKDPNQNRDVAICNVLSMLDPKAPVRFRDFRINPDALGISLAVALAQKKDVRPFVEVVLRDVMKIWIASQEQHQAEYNQYSAELRDLKTYLGQATKGGGIERCLYEVNESLGCRSPLVRNEAVLEMSDLLPALERVAGKKIDRKIWPIDRHIAAFIVARFPRDTMAQIHSLNDRDPKRSALGMLGLLAVLQWKMGPEAVPGLASWIGGLMSPVIESYHSRERRRRLEKEVPKVVRKGNLPELYNLLDNGEERQSDHDEFAAAREEYRQAAQQIAALESGNYTVSEASQKLGQQTASSLSVAAAVITLVFVVLSTLV